MLKCIIYRSTKARYVVVSQRPKFSDNYQDLYLEYIKTICLYLLRNSVFLINILHVDKTCRGGTQIAIIIGMGNIDDSWVESIQMRLHIS